MSEALYTGLVQLTGIGLQQTADVIGETIGAGISTALKYCGVVLMTIGNADGDVLSAADAARVNNELHAPGSIAGMVGIEPPMIQPNTTKGQAREAVISFRDRLYRQGQQTQKALVRAIAKAGATGDNSDLMALRKQFTDNLSMTKQASFASQLSEVVDIDVDSSVDNTKRTKFRLIAKSQKAAIATFLDALDRRMSISGCSGERTTIVVPKSRGFGSGYVQGQAAFTAAAANALSPGYTAIASYVSDPSALAFTGSLTPHTGASSTASSANGTLGLASTVQVDGFDLPYGALFPLGSTAARGDVTRSSWTGDIDVRLSGHNTSTDIELPTSGFAIVIESNVAPNAVNDITDKSVNFQSLIRKVHAIVPFDMGTVTISDTVSMRETQSRGRIDVSVETSGNNGVFILVFFDPSQYAGTGNLFVSAVSSPGVIYDVGATSPTNVWRPDPPPELLRLQRIDYARDGPVAGVVDDGDGAFWQDLVLAPIEYVGRAIDGPGRTPSSPYPVAEIGVGTLSDYLKTQSRGITAQMWRNFRVATRACGFPDLPLSPTDMVFAPTKGMLSYQSGVSQLVRDLSFANLNTNWMDQQ